MQATGIIGRVCGLILLGPSFLLSCAAHALPGDPAPAFAECPRTGDRFLESLPDFLASNPLETALAAFRDERAQRISRNEPLLRSLFVRKTLGRAGGDHVFFASVVDQVLERLSREGFGTLSLKAISEGNEEQGAIHYAAAQSACLFSRSAMQELVFSSPLSLIASADDRKEVLSALGATAPVDDEARLVADSIFDEVPQAFLRAYKNAFLWRELLLNRWSSPPSFAGEDEDLFDEIVESELSATERFLALPQLGLRASHDLARSGHDDPNGTLSVFSIPSDLLEEWEKRLDRRFVRERRVRNAPMDGVLNALASRVRSDYPAQGTCRKISPNAGRIRIENREYELLLAALDRIHHPGITPWLLDISRLRSARFPQWFLSLATLPYPDTRTDTLLDEWIYPKRLALEVLFRSIPYMESDELEMIRRWAALEIGTISRESQYPEMSFIERVKREFSGKLQAMDARVVLEISTRSWLDRGPKTVGLTDDEVRELLCALSDETRSLHFRNYARRLYWSFTDHPEVTAAMIIAIPLGHLLGLGTVVTAIVRVGYALILANAVTQGARLAIGEIAPQSPLGVTGFNRGQAWVSFAESGVFSLAVTAPRFAAPKVRRYAESLRDLKKAYHTLGLTPKATRGEVTYAYRSLAWKLHPDHSGSAGSAEAFAGATKAYRLILERNTERHLLNCEEALRHWFLLGHAAKTRMTPAKTQPLGLLK